MEVIYKDLGDRIINGEQVEVLSDYIKCYLEQSELKRQETYYNNELNHIDYFLDLNEDDQAALAIFSNLNVRISVVDIKEPLGSFFIERRRTYFNNVLLEHYQTLFDSIDNIVCTQTLNRSTLEPFLDSTSKYYHLPADRLEYLGFDSFVYRCYYGEIGVLQEITETVNGKQRVDGIDFDEFQADNPDVDLSYYMNANFEPL